MGRLTHELQCDQTCSESLTEQVVSAEPAGQLEFTATPQLERNQRCVRRSARAAILSCAPKITRLEVKHRSLRSRTPRARFDQREGTIPAHHGPITVRSLSSSCSRSPSGSSNAGAFGVGQRASRPSIGTRITSTSSQYFRESVKPSPL